MGFVFIVGALGSFSGHVGRREEAMEVERDGRSEVSE